MKRKRGVTLIALVVTIIVLLILAGVSISMVLGENGVVSRATDASEATADGDMKSVLAVAISGAQGDYIEVWNKNRDEVFLDCLVDGDTRPTEENKVWLHSDGYVITLGTKSGETYVEGTKRTITGCTIQKVGKDGTTKIGSEYTFELTEKDRYSAEVTSFSRTK